MMHVMEHIWAVSSRGFEELMAADHPTSPIIYGSFTNWQPKPMREIVDLVEEMHLVYDLEEIIRTMKRER